MKSHRVLEILVPATNETLHGQVEFVRGKKPASGMVYQPEGMLGPCMNLARADAS